MSTRPRANWRSRRRWGRHDTLRRPEVRVADAHHESPLQITFYPDFSKFPGQNGLDEDTLALFRKRVYDVAGSTDVRCKVWMDNKQIPIRSFEDFVKMHIPDPPVPSASDDEDPLADGLMADEEAKIAKERAKEEKLLSDDSRVSGIFARIKKQRWEVILAYNPGDEFRQVSFVNCIRTYKGGAHISYLKEQITKIIREKCEKDASKQKVQKSKIQDSIIVNELFVFVNALIENPDFDSQSKEMMTTKRDNFRDEIVLADNKQVGQFWKREFNSLVGARTLLL